MKSQGIQVIARAGAILRVCAEAKNGLSLAAIAKEVNLPRSTVQRIVSALACEGLLFSDGSHRSIRLGGELFQVAAQHHLDVVEIIHPFLKDLSEVTGETVDLAVLRGSRLVFIDQVTGSQRLRAVSSVGEAFSLHNSANGFTRVKPQSCKSRPNKIPATPIGGCTSGCHGGNCYLQFGRGNRAVSYGPLPAGA